MKHSATKRAFLFALAVAGLLVGVTARSDDAEVPVKDVAGWRIYVAKPGVVKVKLADLPGRPIRLAPDAPVNLTLTTRDVAVPYWVNDEQDLVAFWGEPDSGSHDARGRCYHLRETPGANEKNKRMMSPAPGRGAGDDIVDKGSRTLLPDED